MKKKHQKDQAFLYDQIEKKGDLDFDYSDIRPRINLSQYEKKALTKHFPAFRPQAVAVVCSLLLVVSAVGFGGFMMSRRGAVTEPDTTIGEETPPSPESQPLPQTPVLFPEDKLIWQDTVYVRTNMILEEEDLGIRLGETVSSEYDSGSQQNIRDNPQAALAEHLEIGTPFHRIENREDDIAVFHDNSYVIYRKQLSTDTAP